MKKLILLFVAVMAVCFAVSCSKSDNGIDDGSPKSPTVSDLDNTTWYHGKEKVGFNCIGFKGNRMVWARSIDIASFGSFHYGTYTISNGKLAVVDDENGEQYTLNIVLYKYESGKAYLKIESDESLKDKVPMGTYTPLDLDIINKIE